MWIGVSNSAAVQLEPVRGCLVQCSGTGELCRGFAGAFTAAGIAQPGRFTGCAINSRQRFGRCPAGR